MKVSKGKISWSKPRALIETSIFISLLRKIWIVYFHIDGSLDKIYRYSQIHRLTKAFWGGTKVNFKYSFFGKITNLEEENNTAILDNSKFIRRLVILFKTCKEKILIYSRTSTTVDLTKEAKKELYFLSLKKFSIIVVIAILTNLFFSIVVNKEIGLLGWIMRGSLLFVGISGIFCNTDWQVVRGNSIILRLIKKRQK